MVYRGSPRKTIIIIICSAFETYWSSSLDLSKILFCLGNLTRTEFHLQFKPVSFKFVANYFIRFVYHLTLKKKRVLTRGRRKLLNRRWVRQMTLHHRGRISRETGRSSVRPKHLTSCPDMPRWMKVQCSRRILNRRCWCDRTGQRRASRNWRWLLLLDARS